MDVLVIGPNSDIGGIQKYIDQQEEHLADSVSVRVYDTEVLNGSGIVWFILAVAQTMMGWLRFPFRRRPDVAHVHAAHWFSFYRKSVYILFITLIWRRPVVLHIHGSSFDEFVQTDRRFPRMVQRIVYSVVDRIIVLSPSWAEIVGELAPDHKLVTLQNAVDPDEFEADVDDRPHIVYISHLIHRKGAHDFAPAIDGLLTEGVDADITICGAGDLAPEIERLSRKHDRVTYRGYVSEEEKRDVLRDGTIYVLPSYAEGLPIAILEAMAAGNAIVSTTVGAIPEVIDDDNGRLVRPGDVTGLKTALAELSTSPDEVKKMAETNRELVEYRYSWGVVKRKLLGTYDSLLHDRRASVT